MRARCCDLGGVYKWTGQLAAGASVAAKSAWTGLAAGFLHTLCGPDHLAVSANCFFEERQRRRQHSHSSMQARQHCAAAAMAEIGIQLGVQLQKNLPQLAFVRAGCHSKPIVAVPC